MPWNQIKLAKKGLEWQNRSEDVTIVAVKTGSGFGTADIEEMEELAQVCQQAEITDTKITGSLKQIHARFSSRNASASYTFRELGVYAKITGTDGVFLYAACSFEGENAVVVDPSDPMEFYSILTMRIGNAAEMTVEFSEPYYATRSEMEEVAQEQMMLRGEINRAGRYIYAKTSVWPGALLCDGSVLSGAEWPRLAEIAASDEVVSISDINGEEANTCEAVNSANASAYPPDNVFDGDDDTYWTGTSTSSSPCSVSCLYSRPMLISVHRIKITAYTNASVRLEYLSEGDEWLDTGAEIKLAAAVQFVRHTPVMAKGVRFTVSRTASSSYSYNVYVLESADGPQSFRLPDFRGRLPLGADGTVLAGSTGGRSSVSLTAANNASHTHTMSHTHTIAHTHSVTPTFTASSQYVISTSMGSAQVFRTPGTGVVLYGTPLASAIFMNTVTSSGVSSSSSGSASTSTTTSSGSGTSFDILNPYVGVNVFVTHGEQI